MGTLADRVCLVQPRGELVIEFLRSCDPEAMHEQTLRVRARPLDTSIDNAPLEVEIPGQGCLSRRYAGESSAAPFERDRGLRHRVAERATSLSESDEPVVKHDDLLRLVAQMSLDGPLLVHQPTVSARGLTLRLCDGPGPPVTPTLTTPLRGEGPTPGAAVRLEAWRRRGRFSHRATADPLLTRSENPWSEAGSCSDLLLRVYPLSRLREQGQRCCTSLPQHRQPRERASFLGWRSPWNR